MVEQNASNLPVTLMPVQIFLGGCDVMRRGLSEHLPTVSNLKSSTFKAPLIVVQEHCYLRTPNIVYRDSELFARLSGACNWTPPFNKRLENLFELANSLLRH